jgi:hypothetical protein
MMMNYLMVKMVERMKVMKYQMVVESYYDNEDQVKEQQ